MPRTSDPDYWEAHPGRASFMGVSWAAALVIFILLVGAAVSLVVFVLNTGTASVRGRANAYQQQQSANNRVFAQQHFETLYGDVKAADRKLAQAKADVAAHPGDRYYQTNYDGLVNLCDDDVAQYNQDAAKYLLKDFRTADLPSHIDSTDPTTDCQP
jgi:hypothetical protein